MFLRLKRKKHSTGQQTFGLHSRSNMRFGSVNVSSSSAHRLEQRQLRLVERASFDPLTQNLPSSRSREGRCLLRLHVQLWKPNTALFRTTPMTNRIEHVDLEADEQLGFEQRYNRSCWYSFPPVRLAMWSLTLSGIPNSGAPNR